MGIASVFAEEENEREARYEAPDMCGISDPSGHRIYRFQGLVEELQADPEDE